MRHYWIQDFLRACRKPCIDHILRDKLTINTGTWDYNLEICFFNFTVFEGSTQKAKGFFLSRSFANITSEVIWFGFAELMIISYLPSLEFYVIYVFQILVWGTRENISHCPLPRPRPTPQLWYWQCSRPGGAGRGCLHRRMCGLRGLQKIVHASAQRRPWLEGKKITTILILQNHNVALAQCISRGRAMALAVVSWYLK